MRGCGNHHLLAAFVIVGLNGLSSINNASKGSTILCVEAWNTSPKTSVVLVQGVPVVRADKRHAPTVTTGSSTKQNVVPNTIPMTTTSATTSTTRNTKAPPLPSNRAQFLQQGTATLLSLAIWSGSSQDAIATMDTAATNNEKLLHLDTIALKEIVRHDVVDSKFLTNGQLTRSIYDESATFTDEIDTYTMDQWITGTQRLFVGDQSRVDLVGDIDVTKECIEFRFDEDLMFNIPFLKPVVHLTGRVVLKRSPETGLITSYQEFWDQDVATVLKSVKL